MSWSLRLLRLREIGVKVHVTFILILAWAAYYWSAGTDRDLQGALFGAVATLPLLGGVTLHKFAQPAGHEVRRHGARHHATAELHDVTG